ncbi:MAG: hypothetical protein JWM37_24 [Candidatus Saccharibacteria bacterium]|nr:hypothetical protein [Candidatus Saccharibacteria bacterium]
MTPLTAPPSPVPASSSLPATAEDTDQIEPEWVHKAEQIVAKTQNDPYAQAQALNALKAEYMQKRYAKTVKVAED